MTPAVDISTEGRAPAPRHGSAPRRSVDAVGFLGVLAGARDEAHLRQLRGLLARATLLPTGPADYEAAAALHRVCRRRGETVGKLIDCLVGAIAVREGAPLLHADTDFDVLARNTDLEIHTPVA
ncbi:MAG: PIN domain-containing protein [Acidimicrobiia bacterium]